MKKITLILAVILGLNLCVKSQATLTGPYINFPDSMFLKALISHSPKIDLNNDGKIDTLEAQKIKTIIVSGKNIKDLTGVEYFVNVDTLHCDANLLTKLNFSKNIFLRELHCFKNKLVHLDISKNIKLTRLICYENKLVNVDVTKHFNLITLICRYNNLTSLDVSKNTELIVLDCILNNLTNLDVSKNTELNILLCSFNNLTNLDITKNVNLTYFDCAVNQLTTLDISNCKNLENLIIQSNPNLQQVCVWTLPFPLKSFTNFDDRSCSPNLKYTFCKGDIPYTNVVKGNVYFDKNKNNVKDNYESFAENFKLNLYPDSFSVNTNTKGEYMGYLESGKSYIVPKIDDKLWAIKPFKDSVLFVGNNKVDTAHNFAIQPIKDTAIFNTELTNITRPRPGFDLFFDINFKNEGTVCLTKGIVQMQYDTTKMTYISSTPNRDMVAIDTLMWNFNSLCPFQSSVVKAKFKVNPKTPIGTKLKIAYCMNADTTHNKATRLQFRKCDTLEIVVQGSFDPNDKAVSPDGNYNVIPVNTQELTYTIRFQNTGTDTAFNIFIKDTLSKNLDASTFNIVAASHANHYQLEKNILTVFFDNILLADSNINEPMSHGYVKYKISPINIKEGTVIDNTAYIYFDFNDPVKTNTAKSILETSTGVISEKYVFSNSIVYPNPASNELKVETHHNASVQSVRIFDIMGKEITNGLTRRLSNDNISTGSMTVDISKLTKGIYIIELTTESGVVRGKFIKE